MAAVVRHQAPDPMWTGYAAAWAAVLLTIVTPACSLRLEPMFAESI